MSDESDRIRVGIVGLGNIGHHHAERLDDADAAALVGGLDVDAEARRRFTEAYDADTFEDAAELYDRVDAVVVTTPNRYHETYAVGALDAGVAVLLEKPLAHTVESGERIAAAARESAAVCMVGFNNRFANPVEVIKHHTAEGRFGEVNHVEADYVRRRGIPGRGTWFTRKDVAGGGALIDIGVHAVDLTLHFLDFPEVVEVTGTTRSQFGDREDYTFLKQWGEDHGPAGFDVEDSASAFLRCADGSTVSLEVAWAANRPDSDHYYLRGTAGGVRYDRGSHELTFFGGDDGGANHLTDTEVATQPSDTHRAEQAYFLRHVAAGEPPERNTVEQGLAVQRVLDAIYRSAEAERAVRLDE